MSAWSLEFELLGLPKRMNESLRGSWRAKYGEAEKWKRLVGWAVACKKPTAPLERARLTLTRFSSVEPDYDGIVSSFKHVIDGLVEHGVLAGDKLRHIGAPMYHWQKAKRGKGMIRVRVECVETVVPERGNA